VLSPGNSGRWGTVRHLDLWGVDQSRFNLPPIAERCKRYVLSVHIFSVLRVEAPHSPRRNGPEIHFSIGTSHRSPAPTWGTTPVPLYPLLYLIHSIALIKRLQSQPPPMPSPGHTSRESLATAAQLRVASMHCFAILGKCLQLRSAKSLHRDCKSDKICKLFCKTLPATKKNCCP